MDSTENRSILGTVITWALIIAASVILIKLAFWLLGAVFGVVGFAVSLAAFAIFRVVPLLIVIWLMIKLYKYVRREVSA